MPNVKARFLLAALLAAPASARAQSAVEAPRDFEAEQQRWIEESTVERSFLILATFRSFTGAAKEVSRLATKTELEVRTTATDLVDGELSYSRELCEQNGWDYPCYVARGRYDEGAYLSIEPSGSYDGMKPGYFLVVAASGTAAEVRAERVSLEQRGVRGLVRTSTVWMGCIH